VPTLALLFLGITVVLWAGTLFLQGYIYSEPVAQAYWRAPLAGVILTVFLAFWCYLDYRSPGRYGALHDVSTSDEERYDRFWAVKKGQEIPFTAKKTAKGRREYYDAQGRPWSRSDTEGVVEAIVIEDKEHQRIRFDAELTPDGKFKAAQEQPVNYVEAGGQGRIMTDSAPGKIPIRRSGLLVANLLLNLLHLGLWFAGLWLLMRFQWSHALGLAFVAWLVLTFILPALFKKTEDLAKQQPVPSSTAKVSFEGIFAKREQPPAQVLAQPPVIRAARIGERGRCCLSDSASALADASG
jgi:hypothetical protein